jgi:molybdenum cofactor biosynthesis protein B
MKLNFCILSISDTRTLATDSSGKKLSELISIDGHHILSHKIVKDNLYEIRAQISNWCIDKNIDVIITSGGTGLTGRDSTPEAILPLLDKTIEGFGELFRMISFDEIGSSTIQSRCIAGTINGKYIFSLPGSTNAVTTAWEKILSKQFNFETKPCNFVTLIPRLNEK